MPYHALHDLHLYLHQPTAIFKARVNMASVTYPVTALTFDGVTLGAFGDIAPDATLILGSADGLDDYGRVRVQNVATSTTIPVGRISQGPHDGELNVTDNAYITVWNDFRVHAKIPYDAPDGIDYKDSNVPVGDYLTTDMPPVANCGPGTADYIDAITGLITVTLPEGGVNESYAMADGATITGYAWDLQGGTVTVGTLTSATLTATFPAGFRWVGLTVTDSNGTSHSARCPVLAVDPAADVTIPFEITSWEKVTQGQTFSFRLLDNRLRTTYPDGCLVLFWWDAPLTPADRSHMQFIGWHQSDSFSIRATDKGLVRDTVLNCVDVAGRLAALPGFPQALQREAEEDVDIMWSLMPGLTMRRCLHYLAFWHSTALSLADFFLPDELDDYPSMRLDSTGASLYEQINSRAQSCVPDYWLTCNAKGQLSVIADWMLLDLADRPTIVASLSEEYWSSMDVEYHRPPRVHVLRSSAVVSSTDWLVLGGEDTLPLAFCIAPGNSFGQGVSESITGEKLTISQDALNRCEGHRYARLNARYGLFSIVEPSGTIAGDAEALEPAAMLPIEVSISAATAAQRGLDFTTTRGMTKRISMRANTTPYGTWLAPTIQFEKEVVGFPAVTHIPDIPDEPDFETPEPPPGTTPPDNGLIGGQQLVAAIGIDGYRYKTADFQTASGSGGPTWERANLSIAATIYSWVVDPFSPGYAPGATTGAINGWVANDTAIYRVTDLFGTTVATSVHTFPTATSGASFHWRSIQASFGAYFAEGVNPWLLCVSYYGSTVGHTGTWATRSTDGGVTWSAEVQITAHYNTTAVTRFNPIGVYASPKTSGLVKTAAYTATIADAVTAGYVSADWGATWASVASIQPGSAQAGTIHLPWPDNISESVLYHGKLTTEIVEGTPEELLPFFGLYKEYQGVSDTDESYTALGYGISGSTEAFAMEPGTVAGVEEDAETIIIAPPPDTKRMNATLSWTASRNREGGIPSASTSLTVGEAGTIVRDDTVTFVVPAYNSTVTGSGSIEWTFPGFAGGDWPINSETIQSSPPTSLVGCRVRAYCNANGAGDNFADATISYTVTVTEIELDDGTIYTPVLGSGARSFRLKRVTNGLIEDISPTDGTILYGVNRGHFGVRSYDSDRQYVVAAVIGNDISGDPASDKHAVYISSTYGNTWTQVVAPIADSGAPAGRPAFEAAFGGDNEDIIFIWGPNVYISYSSNFGVAVDSRVGNLAALGLTSGLIGIAGGPTP